MAAVPATVPALCRELAAHWTSIAHHLYLRSEPPVPLPAVGPLAELLHVTRGVCEQLNARAGAGGLTQADVRAALSSKSVQLLATLAQWLQAGPHEALLLNDERSASLWQQLLLTLANLLKAAQPERSSSGSVSSSNEERALVVDFQRQLQASGLLGKARSSSDEAAASSDAAAPAAPPSGLLPALQWLLEQHPHRCLTASAGAWLLLQELVLPISDSAGGGEEAAAADGADGSGSTAEAGQAAATGAASASASRGDEASAGQQPNGLPYISSLADALPQLGQLLQAYIDRAYASAASPPALPQQAPVGGPAGRAKKGAGAGSSDGSGSTAPAAGSKTPAAGEEPAAAGGASKAAAAGGSADAPTTGAPAAPAGGGSDTWSLAHPVCLVDDPALSVFSHLVALLHALQVHLLLVPMPEPTAAAASDGASSGGGGSGSSGSRYGGALPVTGHLQALALANAWLLAQLEAAAAAGTPGAADAAGRIPRDHAALLPLPRVALDAAQQVGVSDAPTVLQLALLASQALQADAAAAAQQLNSGAEQSAFDAALAFKLQLEAIALLQACGAEELPQLLFEQLAFCVRCCHSRDTVQQLLTERGQVVLRVLADLLQLNNQQQQQSQEPGSDAAATTPTAAAAAASSRCVLCAHVLLELCPGHVLGSRGARRELMDEALLGSLTETDPPRFYAILDHLVRRVAPSSLSLLLPMSAAFLAQDSAAVEAQTLEHSRAQQPGEQAAASDDGGSSSSGGGGSGKLAGGRSLVILQDAAVCRTFAAALHGYCRSVVSPLVAAGGRASDAADPGSGDAAGGPGANGAAHAHEHEHTHASCSGCCGHEHGEHDHGTPPVAAVLPPLQKVAEWLVLCLDLTIASAMAEERALRRGEEAGSSGAAAPAGGGGPAAAAKMRAAQLAAASQPAACSLALVALLARAVVPVLARLQQEVEQLQPADEPGAAGASGSGSGDVALPDTVAVDVLSGLVFVRAVYRALCARCFLAQLLHERCDALQVDAAQAAQAAAAAKRGGGGGGAKRGGGAAAAAAAAAGAAAAADAKAAFEVGRAALLGQSGLARGWGHLVASPPLDVLGRIKTFQAAWPGDFVAGLAATRPLLAAAGDARAKDAPPPGGEQPDAPEQLPGAARVQLLELLADAQGVFGHVLDELPLPVGCNNAACSNLEAVAEASLSINKRCSSCLAAHYCSRACQTAHWPAHKAACKRVRSHAAG